MRAFIFFGGIAAMINVAILYQTNEPKIFYSPEQEMVLYLGMAAVCFVVWFLD